MFCSTLLPTSNSRCKSKPNILMAILARVPESIWSIRWAMGCPKVMLTPGATLNLFRTSSKNSSFVLSSRTKGTSISEALTPCACSSSSARPCLLVTTSTSGISNSIVSINLPVLLLSSKDIPGGPTTLITKEPSLNSGRKLLPNCVTTKRLNRKTITVTPIMVLGIRVARSKRLP